MDLRSGRTYATREEALNRGVPESDLAEVTAVNGRPPLVRFSSGPFKDRVYRRDHRGQLVRVKDESKVAADA